MTFFKHVGTANGAKKVIIVQRQLPGEEHMAAVIYSEIIPSRFHDDIMKELESDAGQAANEFKDVLERRFFSNGENMLQSLHNEGFIKKVASNNVIVRPNSKSSIRLDELNKMLANIRSGRSASAEFERMNDGEDTVSAEQLAVAPATPAAAPAPAPAVDQTALMMQMMETMKSMQAEIASIKTEKRGRGRPPKSAS